MEAQMVANMIAVFALFISFVAAGFAWHSAEQAKKANQISIHQYQKSLYEAFYEVHQHIVTQGVTSDYQKLRAFGVHVKTARIYIGVEVAKLLSSYYDECYRFGELQGMHITKKAEEKFARDQLFPSRNSEEFLLDYDRAKKDFDIAFEQLLECARGLTDQGKRIDEKFQTHIKLVD